MKRLLIACAAALLTGCTTLADQLQGSLQPAPDSGHAILAMTVRTYAPENATAMVYWHGLDNGLKGVLRANFGLDSIFGPAGSDPVIGRLQLLALPPGRYMLDKATARWADDTAGDNLAINTQRSASFALGQSFTVTAGHSVYLGDIRFNLDYRPDLSYLDSHPRDYAHMQRVWHINDSDSVQLQLLPGTQ